MEMNKKTVRDLDVQNKRVLIRVDFNVPIQDGGVADDTRIVAALPTINYVLEHGGAVILMSHLGRPKGQPNPQYSLRPVIEPLAELLGRSVQFAAFGIYTDGSYQDITGQVTWVSGDNSIADFDPGSGIEGLIDTYDLGSIMVSASASGVSSDDSGNSALFEVTDPELEYISVTPAAAFVPAGRSEQGSMEPKSRWLRRLGRARRASVASCAERSR